jgi:hypothetical protein
VLPIAHCAEARVQEPSQKQHQHWLCDLRWLKGKEVAEANPAMRVMRAGHQEHQHQQDSCDTKNGIDEARRVIAAHVHMHQHQHGKHAQSGPNSLRQNEGVRGVVFLLVNHGRSRKDHH